MTNGADVLGFLLPNGGWIISGHEYEGISFLDCEPITKAQFEAGFAQYETHKANQAAIKATEKAALLAKLGITADEAALLLL